MESPEPLTLLDAAWKQLQDHKQRINEEIRNYPRPIAACDLQFNYLLEERARIASALDRIQEERQNIRTVNPLASSLCADLSQQG